MNLETYLAEFDSAEKIDRGMAGDDKYRCRCGTDEFLWAKYFAPNELDSIMGLNKSILTIFDDMENPIPKWYRRDMCDSVAHI